MTHFSPAILAASLLAVAAPASAAVVPAGFVAEAIEDYEDTGGESTILGTIFDTDVAIDGTRTHRSVTEGDWTDFRSLEFVTPNSGDTFGVIFGLGPIELDFSGLGGIFGFSGWATAITNRDDVLEFFDLDGDLIDTVTQVGGFGPGDGTMEAFSFVSTDAIGTVRLTGLETAYDDFGYTTRATVPMPSLAVVPLPAGGLLLGGALLAFGALGRRRRRAR